MKMAYAGEDGALTRERSNLDGSMEGGKIWLRFCPHPVREDPLLQSIERYLLEPETRQQLEICEINETYPDSIIQHLKGLGLNQFFFDVGSVTPKTTAYHLSALNFVTARMTASLAITVGVNSLALLSAYRGASSQQLRKILDLVRDGAFCALALTELEQGSDLVRIRSCAIPGVLSAQGAFISISDSRHATHYILKARKQLINGGSRHQLLFVLVKNMLDDKVSVTGQSKRDEHSLFWIEQNATATDMNRWHTLSASAADISEVHLKDALVDVDHRVGNEGEGLALIQDTLAMSRGGVAALAVGTLSRARDLVLAYAVKRKVYGRRIGDLGGIAGHIVRLDAMERAATAASLRATSWVNACGVGAAPYTAVAKLISCQLAEEGIAEGRHVLGARAILSQLPYARLIRDVLLFGVFDGTSHLMLEELQMYLSMEARRWEPNVRQDTIAVMRSVYSMPMRSLVDVCQSEHDVRPFAVAAHTRNIANISGEVSIQPVVDLVQALFVVTAEAKRQRKWGSDQELRFALAQVYALIEVIMGLVELFDPIRRESFAAYRSSRHPADDLGYQHAFGWLGSRACAKLAECSKGAGLYPFSHAKGELQITGNIADIQSRFLDGQDEIRNKLAKVLLKNC